MSVPYRKKYMWVNKKTEVSHLKVWGGDCWEGGCWEGRWLLGVGVFINLNSETHLCHTDCCSGNSQTLYM